MVEDPSVLRNLCGINDQNIKFLEQTMGVPVYVQGNEFHLKSTQPSQRSFFSRIIQELDIRVQKGQNVSQDLISGLEAVITRGETQGLDLLNRTHLDLPHGMGKVFPRSLGQARIMEALGTSDLVFALGPAGTGKTYLAVAAALAEVLTKKKRKLVLTRPVVEAGENLGFLPGDLSQKISPYLRPLYDAIEDLVGAETLARMEENRIIEIAPLAYMRGRSLKNSVIVLDEAQNTTKSQMKMFLTRLGENSKAIVTGDMSQIDLPRSQDSGLIQAEALLKDIPGIDFCFLDKQDVVRNPLVRKIIEAYEKT